MIDEESQKETKNENMVNRITISSTKYSISTISSSPQVLDKCFQSTSNDDVNNGLYRMKSIVDEVQAYMKNLLSMKEVPVQTTRLCQKCKTSTIFVSTNYNRCERLIVIIPYREAGIWSRSICLNGDGNVGSMVSYIEKAIKEDYGIVIMNPVSQKCHPKFHVEDVWMQFIAPSSPEIFIIAYSRGSQLVKHLLNWDGGEGIIQDRVRALALVEPSHDIDENDCYFTRRIFARRAIAWLLSSEHIVGFKMPIQGSKYGCICISAGPVLSSVQGSSGGWALNQVMESVFATFAARHGRASGITKNTSKSISCGICQKKLRILNRKIYCSWCQLRVCSRCSSEKYMKESGLNQICILCQTLPCLVDPRKKLITSVQGSKIELIQNNQDINEIEKVSLIDFEIIKLIGRGACGRVKLVRKKKGKDEGSFYAVKAIKKKLVVQKGLVEATIAERRIMHRLDHPFISKLRYAFQTDSKLYLLTDFYPGGNLLDQIRKARRFSEDRARLYAAEVALALNHLHSNNIMYRDLKLENVLCGSDGHIALTDFGMSKENVEKDGIAKTFVGTFQMMAPEILKLQPYTNAIDWWALGIMVYEMIEGRTPFNGKNASLIKQQIFEADAFYSNRFSVDAKDFVVSLLSRDPKDRLGNTSAGFNAIKNHPWFQQLDWNKVLLKQEKYSKQDELARMYAREYREEDIFSTYMNAKEVTIDTPVSCQKNGDSKLFEGFSYNYTESLSFNEEGPFDIDQLRPSEKDELKTNEVTNSSNENFNAQPMSKNISSSKWKVASISAESPSKGFITALHVTESLKLQVLPTVERI